MMSSTAADARRLQSFTYRSYRSLDANKPTADAIAGAQELRNGIIGYREA